MNNPELIEKLKKVLALANGNGATQGEVEAALARAKEIAMRHNIDLASVVAQGEDPTEVIDVEKDSTLRIRSKFQQPYHTWIYHILEKVFGVEVILSCHSSYNGRVVSAIHLIGDSFDVAVAKEIFPYLETVFPRILSKAVSAGLLTYRAADMNGCYQGIAHGILATNRREEEKLSSADSGSMALIVRSKVDAIAALVKELFPDLKKGRATRREVGYEGFQYGKREGSKINLRQVGGGSRSMLS